MGGWGSGPYGPMGNKLRKRTVEETECLDIQKLKGFLDDRKLMAVSWNSGNEITVLPRDEQLFLVYKIGQKTIKTVVDIETTTVGYGERLWFCCPSCDSRTAKLYMANKHFRCRECQNLTYLSCQESGDPLEYLYLKIYKLQKKLGLEKPSVDDVPYSKPKNMHHKTYMQLRLQLQKLQRDRADEFIRQCGVRFGIAK